MERFRFASDPTGDLAASLVGQQLKDAEIVVGDEEVIVTFGSPPAFATTIPRRNIQGAVRVPPLRGALRGATRGVHGSRGRWLVNTSRENLVRIDIRPPVQARMKIDPDLIAGAKLPKNPIIRRWVKRILDRSISLKRLTVGVDRPDDFVRALAQSQR